MTRLHTLRLRAIAIPAPQREIRLLSGTPAADAALRASA